MRAKAEVPTRTQISAMQRDVTESDWRVIFKLKAECQKEKKKRSNQKCRDHEGETAGGGKSK